MRRGFGVACLAAAVILWGTAGPSQAQWSLEWLGHLPGDHGSSPAGISTDAVVVVGSSVQGDYENDYQPEAFRWTASGGMVGLGFLPGHAWSEAFGVSADGSVVVGYSQAGIGQRMFGGEAFRWTAAAHARPGLPARTQPQRAMASRPMGR